LESALDKNTLRALSWMIADEIIVMKIAEHRNPNDGDFHAKIGVFTDQNEDSISFDGSNNDSIRGLSQYESVKTFKSWVPGDRKVIEYEKDRFEDLWEGLDPTVKVSDLPIALREGIIRYRQGSERPYSDPDNGEVVIDRIQPPRTPSEVELRWYQSNAVEKWFGEHFQGVFEMATGTGKTFTALAAAVRLFEKRQRLILVVGCPYKHLVDQWRDEAAIFGWQSVRVADASTKWKPEVAKLLNDFSSGLISHGAIVTTYDAFFDGDLRAMISEYDTDDEDPRGIWSDIMFIADEMHHTGTTRRLKGLPHRVKFRLGLSATPARHYDSYGTKEMLEYFGGIVYEFGMRSAIPEYLTEYFYYPHKVWLDDDEFDEFVMLTNRWKKQHPDPDAPMSHRAKLTLIQRARVLNNARSKVEWIRNHITSEQTQHTLFYVGDRIFEDVKQVLGLELGLDIAEFTHRQSSKERQRILDEFVDIEIQALVAMKCLDEGVDVPPTRTAYFLASAGDPREFVQRRGRILRKFPGKDFATVHDLIAVPKLDMHAGKDEFLAARGAMRRELKRVSIFADLAKNKEDALESLVDIATKLGILDIL
jgi:superfamily II DNA or RNA helicase